MTCIVGLKHGGKVYMGGDAAATTDWNIDAVLQPKVFKRGPFVIGYTSSFRMGQLLEYELDVPNQTTDQKNHEFMVTNFAEAARALFKNRGFIWTENSRESGGLFLVGYRGALYEVSSGFAVLEYRGDFATVGCGGEYAKGALFATPDMPPRKRIKMALKAAAKFSNGVNGPFTVIKQ